MAVSHSQKKVEADAEKMINPLFQEVDQVLQINGRLQQLEGTKQSNYYLPPSNFSQNQFYRNQTQGEPKYLPKKHSTPVSSVHDQDFEFAPKKRSQSTREASASRVTETSPSLPWLPHLDKIIFSSSCFLLIITILLLWEKENQLPFVSLEQFHSSVISPNRQVAVENVKIDTNRQFLSYMERALLEIERDQKLAEKLKTQSSSEVIQPKTDQPSQAVASAPKPAFQGSGESGQPKIPETVSIAQLPALPPPPPQPVFSPAPTTVETPSSTPEETPQKISQESSSPQETTPEQATQKPIPDSSKETVPEPTPDLFPEPSPEKPVHTLVGLIELGSHSAVLFQVGETTKRVMLEETIPGSNWRLISVNDQEAIFEQNQQLKIMSVGEKISVQ